MSGFTKLGLALLLVFCLSLLGFSAELLYVLWYRRRFRRGTSTGADPELASTAVDSDGYGSPSPKDFVFCFLCWKSRSRFGPAAAVAPAFSPDVSPEFRLASGEPVEKSPVAESEKTVATEAASADVELAKWRKMYASRVLFTIREEEREGVESDGSIFSGNGSSRIERLRVVEELEDTPFSTPCASPPFYTPSSSPPRLQ